MTAYIKGQSTRTLRFCTFFKICYSFCDFVYIHTTANTYSVSKCFCQNSFFFIEKHHEALVLVNSFRMYRWIEKLQLLRFSTISFLRYIPLRLYAAVVFGTFISFPLNFCCLCFIVPLISHSFFLSSFNVCQFTFILFSQLFCSLFYFI